MCAYFYINITYICMLINMYDSRWYELTFGIHIFKHICLIMRMSFVSYRTEFKNIFLNVVMASPERR